MFPLNYDKVSWRRVQLQRGRAFHGRDGKTLISRNKGGVIDADPEHPFYVSCNASPPIDFAANFYLFFNKKGLTSEMAMYENEETLFMAVSTATTRDILIFPRLYIASGYLIT